MIYRTKLHNAAKEREMKAKLTGQEIFFETVNAWIEDSHGKISMKTWLLQLEMLKVSALEPIINETIEFSIKSLKYGDDPEQKRSHLQAK